MPFGFKGGFGSYYREPAPSRLTLEELLAQQQRFEPAPPPRRITSVGDLEAGDRKRVQMQSLWSGMGALGASLSTNNWNYAGQGAQQIAALQDAALQDANLRAEATYQQEQAKAAQEFQAQRERGQQAAIYGMYQKAVEGEDPAGPFAAKAEAAARLGNMSQLESLASPETKSRRASARAKGYDPDAWETNLKLQEELAAEIKRQGEAGDWAGEKARQQETLDMQTAAAIAKEKALRDAQLDQYAPPKPAQYESPQHAAAVAEAVEQVRAKYRVQGVGGGEAGVFGGKVYKQGEKLVIAKPADASHAEPYVVPLAGQPQEVGSFLYFTDSDGRRYVQDKERPDLGAFEVDVHAKGDKGYDAGVQHFKQPPPAAPRAAQPAPKPITLQAPPPVPSPEQIPPEARQLSVQITGALLRGGTPLEGLQRLRQAYPQGVGGLTPEQLLQIAMAEARKRGGR